MKIVSVVGARPQFVKLAPLAQAASVAGVNHAIVHTGQHYDPMLSASFFDELGIPEPDVKLEVGSGTHGTQTGAMLSLMDEALEGLTPDIVLVYGDTNSTLAAAVSAAKLKLPLAHLEAGLRSFNRNMPEEHNRVLTDHAADLCLAPTEVAMTNLRREGLAHRSVMVGDIMTDVLFRIRSQVEARPQKTHSRLGVHARDYYLATIHRAENTDSRERLDEIVTALASLDRTVLLLVHPRLSDAAARHGVVLSQGSIRSVPPASYPDLVELVLGSAGVVTDSGGLQKEAFLLRVPCTTIRTETEWTETVDLGWNELSNRPSDILQAVRRPTPLATSEKPYGDGHAATRIVEELVKLHRRKVL